MSREVFISAVEEGNKVVSVSLDRTFGDILSVVVCSNDLVATLVVFDCSNEVIRDFVIEPMKDWGDVARLELIVALCVARKEVFFACDLMGTPMMLLES